MWNQFQILDIVTEDFKKRGSFWSPSRFQVSKSPRKFCFAQYTTFSAHSVSNNKIIYRWIEILYRWIDQSELTMMRKKGSSTVNIISILSLLDEECRCTSEYGMYTQDGQLIKSNCSHWDNNPTKWCYLTGGMNGSTCPGARKSLAGNFYWSDHKTVCGGKKISYIPLKYYNHSFLDCLPVSTNYSTPHVRAQLQSAERKLGLLVGHLLYGII